MAASAFHARSNSLPSRPHPLTSVVDGQLSRLRTSQSASTSTSLNQNLISLHDLHDSVEKLLRLPSTQQSIDKEIVDKLLDGSLRLLDLCNTTKDALLQTRECIQEVQSVLRRRGGSEMELAKEVKKYLSSKKTIRKAILKALKNLKHKENKCSILGEVEAISLSVIESLLYFIAGPEVERKKSNLSQVSKLLRIKGLRCKEEQGLNEIASAEAGLLSLTEGKSDKVNIGNVQTELQKSEFCIQDLEEGMEGLFRHLIKARVTLLNILS